MGDFPGQNIRTSKRPEQTAGQTPSSPRHSNLRITSGNFASFRHVARSFHVFKWSKRSSCRSTMADRPSGRPSTRSILSESGNKTRASGVVYPTSHEFPVFVNLFRPFVVLLHQTTVNQVTRPTRPHKRRTRTMLSRRWSTNEQLTCTGCFAYEPANTAPVRTLRL